MSQEQVLKLLQDNGKRITQQRKILVDVILNGQWECCKEIYYEASRRDKGIGSATVYRMVNLLEEIGAINRKNMYKISFPENCTMEEACIVEMSDNTTCRLSARKWNEVLQTGLEACGYLEGREVKGVVLHPCACD